MHLACIIFVKEEILILINADIFSVLRIEFIIFTLQFFHKIYKINAESAIKNREFFYKNI